MNYEEWSEKVENNQAELTNEYFNMQVGLHYSEKKIHELELKNAALAKEFLEKIKKPEDVYRESVKIVASAQTFKTFLKLNNLRKTVIKSKKHYFRGKPVTWNTWRQFVVNTKDNARKEVYDEFIKLTPKLSPLIQEFFETNKKVFKKYNQTILQNYLLSHKTSYDKVIEFLKKLRDKIKNNYWEEFNKETIRILGREPEYYDDLYFMRNVIYNDLVGKFKKINPLKSVKKTFIKLGLNPSKIHVDSEDRPDKNPSPFCSAPRIPHDVRISYKAENPLNDIKSIYHEMGHAIHETHVAASLPFHERYIYSIGLAETFSQFFESLISNETYLREELMLSEELAKEYVRRSKVMKLITFAFYTGNSLFKLKMYHDNVSFEKLNDLYSEEQKKSMNLEIPGAYWQLHHILPEYLLYVPSYLLAQANVCEMLEKCEEISGKKWWNSKKAGSYLLKLMLPGAKSPLADFSKINPNKLIKKLNQ